MQLSIYYTYSWVTKLNDKTFFYLGIQIGIYLIETWAESRQLKRYFSKEIPEKLKNIKEITQEAYDKA